MNSELQNKLAKIRPILGSLGKNGLLIEKQNNIAWLTGGRSHISLAAETGVFSLLVTEEKLYLVTNNIEKNRFLEEEFSGSDIDVVEYFWFEEDKKTQLLNELTQGIYIKDSEIEHLIKPLRLIFTEHEIALYRELGRDTAQIMEETCLLVEPGMTEYKVASIMAQKAIEKGIEPLVLLVAADERIAKYRHPLPTRKEITDYVMLVMGLRRSGLITCITRFVSFAKLDEELLRKRNGCMQIAAAAITSSRPGNTTAKVFRTMLDEYQAAGYADEWQLHHQGGLAGYCPREYKVTLDTDIEINLNQAFAWNPSITGFKAEDTILVLKDGNQIITQTVNLPAIDIKYNGQVVRVADILLK